MSEVWEAYEGRMGPEEHRPVLSNDGRPIPGVTQAQYDEIMAGLP